MGNSCSHVTVQQVKDHLEGDLLASAKRVYRELTQKDLPADHNELTDATRAIAEVIFRNTFNYDWKETGVSPPGMDKVNPQAHIAFDYCIVGGNDNLTNAIGGYVDDGLKASDIDGWMKKKASADLASIIGNFMRYPVDNEWKTGSRNEQYNAANTDEDSYKLDLSVVYTNSTRSESNVAVTLHIFYYIGVYYTVDSPSKTTFATMRQLAYDAAAKLAGRNSVSTDPQLRNALFSYGTAANGLYFNDFQRDWTAWPKDGATDETEPVNLKNDELTFFNEKDPKILTDDKLYNYIDLYVMSGFDVPNEGMKAWMRKMLFDEFKAIVNQTPTNGWTPMKISQSYGLRDATIRPVRLNADLLYWVGHETITVNNEDVSIYVVYIFVFGLLYEVQRDPIVDDLTRTLVNHIPGVDHSLIPSYISADALNSYVEGWNRDKFSKDFDIVFPTAKKSKDDKIKWWSAYCQFDHWNPTDDEIKQKIDDNIFARDDTVDLQIKRGLQPKVYDWLQKLFSDFAGTKTSKNPNEWYNTTSSSNFPYLAKDGVTTWVLDTSTSWAYCNATITEDGRGGETLNVSYMSILIYCTANATDDDDGGI